MMHLDGSRDSQHPALPVSQAAIAGYLWTRTHKLREIWSVLRAVRNWPGMAITPDQGGLRLTLSGVFLGHLRWNGRLDVPFSPEMRDRLVSEEMAGRDPDEPGEYGVMFHIRTVADADHAVWLLRLAYLSAESNPEVRAMGGAPLAGPRA